MSRDVGVTPGQSARRRRMERHEHRNRLLLPSRLLLYFLWRSLRQRVFLLGLPFLMDMYYSVFFDRLKPFWMPSHVGCRPTT